MRVVVKWGCTRAFWMCELGDRSYLRIWEAMSQYSHPDDVPHSIRTGLQQCSLQVSPNLSQYLIVTSPSTAHNHQTTTPQQYTHEHAHITLPSQPATTPPHSAAAAATAFHAVHPEAQADGSLIWRQLSQVLIPQEVMSPLEDLQSNELGQMQDMACPEWLETLS